MASITTLLITDSLSSSRIVINDNFAALNDELTDIAGLLDVSSQTLTLIGALNGGSLNIVSGGSNVFSATSSDVIAAVPVTLEDSLTLEGSMMHSISAGITTLPAVNSYLKTTYIIDSTAFTGAQVINAGNDGQNVTFIADGGDFTIDVTNIAGATSLVIHDNGTLTLRYSSANSLWYIISSANADVNF